MLPPSIEWLQNPELKPGKRLAWIEQFVDFLFCEPLTVGKIFGSSDLDEVCQQIGHQNIERLGLVAPPTGNPEVVIYIATKLQASGGHTAALFDMIRLSPKQRSIVVVTDVCGKTNRNSIAQRFSKIPNTELVYVPSGGHLAKLTWIQIFLNQQVPSIVWLFNHHQDSVAVAAVQPNRGYHLNFYHHGDDRLSLGVCLNFGTHFDTSPILFHNCRQLVQVHDNRYLPLAVMDQFQKQITYKKNHVSGLTTSTAAGFNKVEVDYFIQYIDIIPQLLSVTRGRHIHIGRLSVLARWHIRRQMCKKGIPHESFVYIPYVPSVWRALKEHEVDLYLTSFPYGGGRTLVEVMGAGVPAIVHRNISDRMIGGLDMVYDGAYTWREPEELYDLLRMADHTFLVTQSRMARAWYEKYHSDKVIAETINNRATLDVPELKPDYSPDPLLHAWQIAQEVTLSGVLKRQLWRLYRRCKSALGRHIFLGFKAGN